MIIIPHYREKHCFPAEAKTRRHFSLGHVPHAATKKTVKMKAGSCLTISVDFIFKKEILCGDLCFTTKEKLKQKRKMTWENDIHEKMQSFTMQSCLLPGKSL